MHYCSVCSVSSCCQSWGSHLLYPRILIVELFRCGSVWFLKEIEPTHSDHCTSPQGSSIPVLLTWKTARKIRNSEFRCMYTVQNIIWSTVQYILKKLERWLKWCSFWWQAFIDVEKDLTERETPMDRLICGDVGFGKTEVAMRAIFIVVSAGFQAMVLAPTIILAKQHYDVMTERFANYPEIKVAIFSGAQVCHGRS